MVNPGKVLKRRSSKRQSLHDKHKIEKKVREHQRKVRRDAKRNPNKYKKRDPGIPNSWPFKQQLIMQQEAAREAQRQADVASREAKIRERQLARQAEAALAAASKQTARQRREARRRKAAFAPLHDVLADADVVLIVLDARDPAACRSPALEQALLECGKLPILVLNKSDLVPRESINGWISYLSEQLPTIAFSCGRETKATDSQSAVPPKRARPGRKDKVTKKRQQLAIPPAVDTGNNAADQSSEPVGIESLTAVFHARREALKLDEASVLAVGIIGFERCGKRSLLKAVTSSKLEGVTWLERPAALAPMSGGGGMNDVMLRRCPAEHVPQPELIVEAILERCVRRSLLRHFAAADYEKASDFLAGFALAHNLPAPRPIGHSSFVDARAAAMGFIRYVTAGKMSFCTLAPTPDASTRSALPVGLLSKAWRKPNAPVASADSTVLHVELACGEPDEIDLEEPEEELMDEVDGSDADDVVGEEDEDEEDEDEGKEDEEGEEDEDEGEED